MTDLARLVGEDAEHLWEYLPFKKVYYKDGEPWGVLGTYLDNNLTVIFSMANDDMFTIGMFRDILKMYHNMDIALVTDTEEKFDYIKELLSPYDFIFSIGEVEPNGRKFLYSIHYKEDK